MTLLPSLIAGALALLVHLVLLLAAAPLVEDLACLVAGWFNEPRRPARAGWMQGWATALPAALLRPWRRLRFLMSKQPLRAGNASVLAGAAPPVALAVTLVAGALVPSFCIGMSTGPSADLVVILSMLGLARLVTLLGALDAGVAAPGLAAVSSAVGAMLALPGLAVAVCVLSVESGSSSLEAILSGLRVGSPGSTASATGLLAAVALGIAAFAAGGEGAGLSAQLAGPDLALFRYDVALRRLVCIDLVSALLLPGTLALAQSNPLHWLAGLLLWALRVAAGCLVLGVAQGLAGTLSPAGRRRLAALSLLLGLLAPLLALGSRTA